MDSLVCSQAERRCCHQLQAYCSALQSSPESSRPVDSSFLSCWLPLALLAGFIIIILHQYNVLMVSVRLGISSCCMLIIS